MIRSIIGRNPKRFCQIITAIGIGVSTTASAQIGEGGTPPSFRYQTMLRSEAAVTDIPVTFSVEDMKQVDRWQEQEGLTPLCVSTLINVALNPGNSGKWNILPDGQEIWQLELRADGAIALMLYYSDFYIPKGGKLFLYNAEKTQILGAYTHATHPSGGRFATEFVAGDVVTLEYVKDPEGQMPRIEIEAVGYGYNHLSVPEQGGVQLRRGAKSSGPCEVNINCEEGDAWQNQKKGVCHTVQRIGTKSYICTGSLVNNTAQDLKPYVLTAMHCSTEKNTEASDENMKQWVFYFHMEQSGCSTSSPAVGSKTLTGCKRMAYTLTNGQSDGLLLLLNTPVPENYNVYYNGWDRRNRPPRSGVCIHHPKGDYKKISTYSKPGTHSTFVSDNDLKGDMHAHWNVTFSKTRNGHGVTEDGSSGSPLFNTDKLIVGTLTGGSSTCTKPEGLNLYGKMSYHWNKYTDQPHSHMDQFLDPKKSGVEVLEGRYHTLLMPPSNLRSTYQTGTVVLAWDAPASGIPQGYRVYRNNTKIEETNARSYIDPSPPAGTVTYAVTAVYANGNESSSITSTLALTEYKAPDNVKVTRTSTGKAAVVWDMPVYEQTIYWGGENSKYEVNMNKEGETKPFYFGQAWTRDEIMPLHLKTITAVKFIPIQNNTYEIYIVQGNRSYRQKIVDVTYRRTNTIKLTTPFVINGTQPLTVAIYVSELSASSTNYPAVCDQGPAIDGKGDLYSYDGKMWKTLHSGPDAHKFNFNFFIAAVVSSKSGELPTTYSSEVSMPQLFSTSSTETVRVQKAQIADIELDTVSMRSLQPYAFPQVTGYHIYRDKVKIATVSAAPTRYIDPMTHPKPVYYQVSALYGNAESVWSKAVEFIPMSNVPGAEDVTIYPTVFTEQLHLKGAERVKRIEFYTVDGRLRLQADRPGGVIDTHSLSSGMYLIRIYTIDGQTDVARGVRK